MFIFFNVVVNFYRSLGLSPIPVMQLTDIDPKIYEKRSLKNENTEWEITNRNFVDLIRDLKSLQVLNAFHFTKVSDFLGRMKNDVIKTLDSKNGYSYGGNVYLRINSDIKSPFGYRLQDIDDMPIDISEGKIDQKDILIWNSENFYQELCRNDILATGIPGWHYQDFEVINTVFNGIYDIHGGARELIYPHHQFIYELLNQSNRKDQKSNKFPKWVHLGLLTVNSKKMSNSSQNTVLISDTVKRFNPNSIKIFFLLNDYKKDIEFDSEKLYEACDMDETISNSLLDRKNNNDKKILTTQLEKNHDYKKFLKFLENDYDTNNALKFIFEKMAKCENIGILKKMMNILGLQYY